MGLLVGLLAVVGLVLLLTQTVLGGADLTAQIDTCEISADGLLSAEGTVRSDEDVDTTIEVRFDDADTGERVDSEVVEVAGDKGTDIDWSATGSAGDEVRRVDCVVVEGG